MAICTTLAITLACILAAPFTRNAAAADAELAKVKANLLAYLTGAEADRKHTSVLDSLKDIEHRRKQH